MRLFLLLSAIFLLGCRNDPPDEVLQPDLKWPMTEEAGPGNITVTIEPDEGGIVRGEHFSLSVLVKPIGGSGAKVVRIAVDAEMPAHRHGMNTKPEVVELGVFQYRVDGMLFHMAGEWVIKVEVTTDSVTGRASFPVLVE